MNRLDTELAKVWRRWAARVDRQASELPPAAAIDFRCTHRPVTAAALLTASASALIAAPGFSRAWHQQRQDPRGVRAVK